MKYTIQSNLNQRINSVKDHANDAPAEHLPVQKDQSRLASAPRYADMVLTPPLDWYRASNVPATATRRLHLRADSPNVSSARPTHSLTNRQLRLSQYARPSAVPEPTLLLDWPHVLLAPVSI